MARRIRWQIVIAVTSGFLVTVLLGGLTFSTTTVSRPLAGGTYTEAVVGTPTHIIPLVNDPLTDPIGRDIIALLFDGLTQVGVDGLVEPALASQWTISEDGKTYTFNLRRDVVWHDGKPFQADDVIFTIEAIQGAGFAGDTSLATLWRNVLVERVDDYTVKFTLNAPYARFLDDVRLLILPAHLLEADDMQTWASSPFAQHPIGTGPFQLETITASGALLKANPSYFAGMPFLQQVQLRFIDTPQVALSSLLHREVQTAGMRASPELEQVALPRTVARERVPLDEYAVLTFNLRQPPLNQLELRRGLAYGLHKDRLIADAGGGSVVRLDTPILPGWWACDPTATWYAYDTSLAQQAIERAGYRITAEGVQDGSGQRLILPLITDAEPMRVAAAEHIAMQWRELGIEVQVEVLEREVLRQRLRDHTFTMALHGWARLGLDPDVFELWHSTQAGDGLNYAGLRDDNIDRALANGRTESDMVVRGEYYADFQQRWIELVPSITLYQPTYLFNASEQVHGYHLGGSSVKDHSLLVGREDRYRTVVEWFVNSSREIQGTLR